jgi:hypothetical protein
MCFVTVKESLTNPPPNTCFLLFYGHSGSWVKSFLCGALFDLNYAFPYSCVEVLQT